MNLQTIGVVVGIASGLAVICGAAATVVRLLKPWVARGRYCKEGTLLQRPGHPAVFVVIGGQRHAIPNEETFNEMGYDWAEIQLVPQHVIDGIPYGGELPGRTKATTVAAPPLERPMQASSEADLRVMVQPQRVDRHGKVVLMLFGTRAGGLFTGYECVVTSPNGSSWRCALDPPPASDVLTFPDDFAEADTATPGYYKVGLYVSSFEVTVRTLVGPKPFFETSFEVAGASTHD